MLRQCTCALLAVLVSLLAFAGVLQGTSAWWAGQGGSQVDARSLLTVRLYSTGGAGNDMPIAKMDAARRPTGESISERISESAGVSETVSEAIPATTGYVPAPELSERPVLLQDLDSVIEFPTSAMASAGWTGAEDMPSLSTATGILLINREGSVDRLLFEAPGYPRYLEAMLAQRFADVRFLPGKIDGKPVPSALRISLQLQ